MEVNYVFSLWNFELSCFLVFRAVVVVFDIVAIRIGNLKTIYLIGFRFDSSFAFDIMVMSSIIVVRIKNLASNY